AHGGVWECPDLFPLTFDGKTWWVLFVSINPGGPNGGSGTQYFIGQFDGSRFTPADEQTKWIDYGPDDYAGVTWSNTGNRRIFLGWMSNWNYANEVPTRSWRNAMTLPRELRLRKEDNTVFLCSQPVKELNALKLHPPAALPDSGASQYIAGFRADATKDFSIVLSNAAGESLTIGFDKASDRYYIDRRHAGLAAFHQGFAATSYAPRLTRDSKATLTLVVDAASAELFADGGLTVMTSIFFPAKPLGRISLHSASPDGIRQVSWSELKSIW
ncbi:MAG: GH32 C-terminal domain-containing protein, partial [Bacteroidota bacterium]|nr:GH32 C-terminal domain-containing protein [Bacteroidota bacterium]